MNTQRNWQRRSDVAYEVLGNVVVTFVPSLREVRRLDAATTAVFLMLAKPATEYELGTVLRNDAAFPTQHGDDVLRLLLALETWALIEQVS